jgi:hypothetical protein
MTTGFTEKVSWLEQILFSVRVNLLYPTFNVSALGNKPTTKPHKTSLM